MVTFGFQFPQMRTTVLLMAAVLLLARCSGDEKSLPSASGLVGDIYVMMDSLQMKGPVGSFLDSVLTAEMPGLPRKESIFKVRWVDVRRLNYILKERRNLIFVMTLDQQSQGAAIIRKFFTPESIELIRSKPGYYFSTTSDVFARNQEIVYLFGPDEQTLLRNMRSNPDFLTDFFDRHEKERLTQSLFKAGRVGGVSELLNKEFQCDLQVPFGYKLADKQTDFLWVRQINPRDDKDIFIARKKYVSQEDFKMDKIIRFRDEICQKYLYGDPDRAESYLMTETKPFIPVTADTINFNGHFAVQVRGLFKSNDMLLGGPFTGIALVDEGTQQFYYLEGFTISPSRSQREIIRELETILSTFKTSTELGK